MNQALFTVYLSEETFAAANLGAVLQVVGLLLVRQHVAQRRIRGEVKAANLKVDVADRAEFARPVHVCFDVDGGQAIRETAGFGSAVVLLDVPA